jgi:hypothetical protein
MGFTRRQFLSLLGVSAGASALPLAVLAKSPFLASSDVVAGLTGIAPNFSDNLITAPGLAWKLLLKEGDELARGLRFGTNNDYLQYFPLEGSKRGILWVNHEYLTPLLSSKEERTLEVVTAEMDMVGGSLVEVHKTPQGWEPVIGSRFNRRITAKTIIPFSGGHKILGQEKAIGTLANCAGGITPWGTVLTCEENYDGFYGERDRKTGKLIPSEWLQWERFFKHPPEHYGWVVEVNPKTGAAKKHVALGRFAHECATVRVGAGKRPAVYSGDDHNDEHLYKFIADRPQDLSRGTLYVADLAAGRWIPLVHSDSRLKRVFKDQTEILIHCREAAKLVGATPLDRPEDIEVDPYTGDVLVACTNNKKANRPFGKILRIKETKNDPHALTFTHDVFIAGGEAGGLACPDNLAFDQKGNLWITTDMSGSDMHKGVMQNFGNNGLFVVMRHGPQAGIPVQVASAPIDAEFTGPVFSPDGKTLFLSVQHPGELTTELSNPTSRWPRGKPLSSVVTIEGPLLNRITGAI